MSMEPELDALRAAWTAPIGDDGSGFRAARRGRERTLRVRYLLELAVAVGLAGFAVAFARAHFDFETVVWAAAVCLTTAAATAYHVWNWRGLWKSSGQSVTEYAETYERRCHAMLRAVRFGYRFLAVQLAISVPWLTFDWVRGAVQPARYAVALGVLALLTAVFLVSFGISRRRALRELDEVRDFRRELDA